MEEGKALREVFEVIKTIELYCSMAFSFLKMGEKP